MIIKVAYAVAHLLFVGFILPSPSLKFLLLRNIWSCEILLRNSPRSFETTPTCYIILCGSIGNGELWLWVPICHTVSAKFPKNFRIFPHSFEWESTRKKKGTNPGHCGTLPLGRTSFKLYTSHKTLDWNSFRIRRTHDLQQHLIFRAPP